MIEGEFFKNRDFRNIILTIFSVSLFLPSSVSAHLFSDYDEQMAAYEALQKDKQLYDMQQAAPDSIMQMMQNSLVRWNPRYLNINDGKHKRWLEPFWIMSGCENRNAGSIGGFIEISEGYARLCDAVYRDGVSTEDLRPNKPRNIANNSSIAAIFAHECAHFAREDWKRASYRETRGAYNAELAADALGMEFLSNTPEYSPGSAITVRLRNSDTQYVQNTGRHPSNATRIEKERGILKKMSKGRVVVEQSGRTTIDGNLLNDTGFLPDSEDSDSVERTLYVAGQIASAIKKGKWQKKLLSRETEDAVLMRGKKDKTVLVVRDSPQCQIIKIVGTFDFDSTKQANKLKGKEREEANLVAEIEKSAS